MRKHIKFTISATILVLAMGFWLNASIEMDDSPSLMLHHGSARVFDDGLYQYSVNTSPVGVSSLANKPPFPEHSHRGGGSRNKGCRGQAEALLPPTALSPCA